MNELNNYNTINSVIDIPLVKSFVYFYDSWYPFIIICAFLIYKHNKNLFYYYIPSLLLCALFAQITFILYPSIIVRPTIEVKNIEVKKGKENYNNKKMFRKGKHYKYPKHLDTYKRHRGKKGRRELSK